VVALDASIVFASSEKEKHNRPTRAVSGFRPNLATCDNTDDVLAIDLRGAVERSAGAAERAGPCRLICLRLRSRRDLHRTQEARTMPLTSYGVLVGRVLDSRAEGGTDTPHFQIRVQGGGTDFRVAVNVLSQQSPSELLYVADEAFQHPQVQTLADLPDGFTIVPSRPGGIALDYIRGNLFDRRAMRPLPATAPGPDNDLADKLEHYVSRAAADPAARVYAFR